MENNLLRRVCKPLLLILFFCAQAAKADNLCEVSFIQNNAELKPEMKSGWAVINLQKMPFDLVISPKECDNVCNIDSSNPNCTTCSIA